MSIDTIFYKGENYTMYELTYQPLPDVDAYLARMNYTGSREVCL